MPQTAPATPDKVNLEDKLSRFSAHYQPKIVGEPVEVELDGHLLGPEVAEVVPRGVEHCPKADEEVSLMLFEPAGTVNTGTAGGERTVASPERI